MTPTEYVQGVLSTEAPCRPALDRLQANPRWATFLKQQLEQAIALGDRQDALKRLLFYGTALDNQEKIDPTVAISVSDSEPMPFVDHAFLLHRLTDPDNLRLLHAFLGKLTEAVELQKQLYGVLFNGEVLDRVNVGEELGDSQWYDGLVIDVLRTSFEAIWQANNAKLTKVRYKNGFNSDQALNRDLTAERQALETPSSL